MRDRLVQRILICFLFWEMFTESYASETALDYSSRQVSFTAGQHSQWFSKQWDGKELKPGLKVRYRLEDPNHCITSYFLNNFNGKTTGDKFPNRDYVDVITEEMLDTPYGIGFFTREAVATGKGTFYYAIDNGTPKTTNRILNFETVEIPKKSIFDKEVRKLDKIRKEVPDYGINAFDKIINVDNQASFDDLQVLINKAIGNGGKRILVRLDRDVFYYSEKHLFLTQYNYPNARGVKIKIEGVGGCKLIAGGRDYYKTI